MTTDIEKYFPVLQHDSSHPSTLKSSRRSCLDGLYSMVPITEWLPSYDWQESSLNDIAAATTLGFIVTAQSLAHADLCKVHLINGPYSCILPPILYSVFGTCVHSSVGTGGLVSLLVGEQLLKYGDDEEKRTKAAAIFSLLVGFVIMLMGVLKLAFLTRFLSRPALSGFITASAVLIMLSQIKPMLGIPKSDIGGIVTILTTHRDELADISMGAIVMSVTSLFCLMTAKKLKSIHWCLTPCGDFKELGILVVSAVICSKIGKAHNIAVIGSVPSGLPQITWPIKTNDDIALAQEMLPGAILVALVTFLSSFAGAKKFGMQAGYQIVATNELMGLGAANLAGALCGAVPTQIGLSRMGIAYSAGVRSQLGANIYVAFIVAAILQLFSSYLFFMPRCVLNAIIVNGAWHLTDFSHMGWLWSLRYARGFGYRARQRTYVVDFVIWWIAFVGTLAFGPLHGIVATVVVSLVFIIYQVADPPITTLGCSSSGKWMNIKAHSECQLREGILALRVEGPLFYANIERLQEWLSDEEVKADINGRPLIAIILCAAAIPWVDTTALEAFKQMILAYWERNVRFLVSDLAGQPQTIFKHVLGDCLPEISISSSWSTDDCVQYLVEQLRKEKRREQRSAEALEEETIASRISSTSTSPATSPTVIKSGTGPYKLVDQWSSMPLLHRRHSHSTSRSREGSAEMSEVRPLKRLAAWPSSSNMQSAYGLYGEEQDLSVVRPQREHSRPRQERQTSA